ncbi:hypothetical protein TanjilG_14005 [Lupinus angustifolius]|uniref:NAD-dependent epimerase/dehydratase domain-containing protein n=1 Tax=Lupinus angustifolius TaxID=3871 RepID=A0A394DJQ6_LUPAN|nr:hypothetical protein TanjilG_14005 [Lupinus angustifolius]
MEKRCKVCVTGGSSYIGSYLIKKLLEKGYIVHTTLRNLNDEAKIGILRSFPEANTRLVLFKADIYKPHEFEPAIKGCEFVFHIATPYEHQMDSQFKSTSEAAVAAVKSIASYCIESGTVKRLIYTASLLAYSPYKDDGTGFKDYIDETCWTSLNLLNRTIDDDLTNYINSKTQAEKELLSYENGENGSEMEVVKDDETTYQTLKFIEDLDGKIPVVHIDDVCEALIFCTKKPSMHGRFLVAAAYVSSSDVANYYFQTYPEFKLKRKYLEGPKREIKWASTKLKDKGFAYNHDLNKILDDCITCARRIGDL